MKKIIFYLILLFLTTGIGYCGDWPEFTGVWMYSDYSIAAENMTVYEISPDTFYISVTISGVKEESSYDETVELGILDYNEDTNHIKTKVLYSPAQGQVYDVVPGDILYWTYNEVELGVMYFDFSKGKYPQKAETGPFESSDYYGERKDWAEFAGIWYWVSEDGSATEALIFSDSHEASDYAVLELYAESTKESSEVSMEDTGYVLFEIPSYNEGKNTIRLMCLESKGSLTGFAIGSIWFLAYNIDDEEAHFEFSNQGYPEKASYGPYYKMSGEM